MAFRGDNEKTNFERACALAAQVVRDAPGGDAFSVVLMSSAGRLVVSEPSESVEKVVAEIEKLRQPHTGADLGSTLTSVVTLLKDSPPKYTRKEVFFFTDLQHSTWIAPQSPALNSLLQTFKERRVDTVFVDVGQDDAANLAVTGLTLDSDVATTERKAIVKFNLHNYGATAREKVKVKLFVARGPGPESDADFDLGTPKDERNNVLVGAGQDEPISFQYRFDKPGDYVVQIQVENDGLALDDVRSAVIRVRKDTPVLLVNGKPFGERFDQSAEWLRVALNPFEDGKTPPANVPARPTVITPADLAEEKYGPAKHDLAYFDCIYLCDVPMISETVARRLEAYVRRGGGLVIALGDQVQKDEYNRVLFREGNGLLPMPLLGPRTGNAAYYFKLGIEGDPKKEPLLKAFSEGEEYKGLLVPRFERYWGLGERTSDIVKPRKILSLVADQIPGKDREARGLDAPDGGPFLLDWQPPLLNDGKTTRKAAAAAARMRGHVLLIAGPVNADWSNWPITHGYPALMQEMLNYAASGRLREQTVDAGRPLELFLNTPARGVEAVVHTPDRKKEKPTVTDFEDGSHLRFADTEISGIYRIIVTIGGRSEEHLFAVNVPVRNDDRVSTECDLKRTTREELSKAYPAPRLSSSGARAGAARGPTRRQQLDGGSHLPAARHDNCALAAPRRPRPGTCGGNPRLGLRASHHRSNRRGEDRKEKDGEGLGGAVRALGVGHLPDRHRRHPRPRCLDARFPRFRAGGDAPLVRAHAQGAGTITGRKTDVAAGIHVVLLGRQTRPVAGWHRRYRGAGNGRVRLPSRARSSDDARSLPSRRIAARPPGDAVGRAAAATPALVRSPGLAEPRRADRRLAQHEREGALRRPARPRRRRQAGPGS